MSSTPETTDAGAAGDGHTDGNTSMAAITHILALFTWLIGPLVVLLVTDDEFVKSNARKAINWQIWLTIYSIIAGILILVGIGILLLPLLGLIDLVFVVIAAVKAADGEVWSYPLTIDLL
ncbi:DUF4870 domain-containing protein [Halorubrum lipolyticum]|uniref:DUF4870 domain-containing protein n=1 Tax=Halorubrum lipolyticum DSM 21995 TaxID=1227482 RepID=M0NI81_9EURY|nr:DUF4870 domain-containing protein [Halorubrum lipolyticum]EMA57278.1 hypothetical protein C469_16138 [Halorubrum lipolyticum DSM 21995]